MALVVKDGNGQPRNLPLYDPCYSYGITLAPGAGPTDIVELKGSATTIVRIKLVRLTLRSGTVAGGMAFSLQRRSAAATGGTAVTPTISSQAHLLNPNSVAGITADPAPTAVLRHFTGAPTAGAAVGAAIRTGALCLAATAADTARDELIWDFTSRGDNPPVLAGTGDFMCITMSAALATGQTLHYQIEWEEALIANG